MREGIAKHGGYEINTEGDAFQVGAALPDLHVLCPSQPTADFAILHPLQSMSSQDLEHVRSDCDSSRASTPQHAVQNTP